MIFDAIFCSAHARSSAAILNQRYGSRERQPPEIQRQHASNAEIEDRRHRRFHIVEPVHLSAMLPYHIPPRFTLSSPCSSHIQWSLRHTMPLTSCYRSLSRAPPRFSFYAAASCRAIHEDVHAIATHVVPPNRLRKQAAWWRRQ